MSEPSTLRSMSCKPPASGMWSWPSRVWAPHAWKMNAATRWRSSGSCGARSVWWAVAGRPPRSRTTERRHRERCGSSRCAGPGSPAAGRRSTTGSGRLLEEAALARLLSEVAHRRRALFGDRFAPLVSVQRVAPAEHRRPRELGVGDLVVVEPALLAQVVAGEDARSVEPPLVAAEDHVRPGMLRRRWRVWRRGRCRRTPQTTAARRACRTGLDAPRLVEVDGLGYCMPWTHRRMSVADTGSSS
jgi:hypothetical protein